MVGLVLCGSALAQPSDPPAQESLTLTDELDEYPLGLHMEILVDPSGEFTIEEVSSPEFDSQFVPSQAEVPSYGFTEEVYWVRLRLDNQTLATDEWMLEQGFANTQYIDLYTPMPERDGFSVKQTGILRPLSTRDIPYPKIVFKLEIPPGSQQTYYLRFQNSAAMTLALNLWTQDAFQVKYQTEQQIQGLFYGALIGLFFMVLFNLFIEFRDASYIYYLTFLATYIFYFASYDGYTSIYFLADLYYLTPYYGPLAWAAMWMSVLAFGYEFLNVRENIPRLRLFFLVILGVWGLLIVLTPLTDYHFISQFMVPWALVTLMVTLITGVISILRRYRTARFFLIGWSLLLLTVFMTILVRFGVFPSTVFSENAFRIATLLTAASWSLALFDRVNLLKAETESANRKLQISENRLSQILEGLPIGVVLYGKDAKPQYVNRRTVEILNDPARNIQVDISVGRTLAEAIDYFSLKVAGSNEIYPLEKIPIYSALHGEPASADDVEADLGDSRVPLEIWASPLRDEAGDVESAVVAFQDISSRKQAEMERHISEARFRVIAENNPDGIAFMGRDRKVIYVSPSYLRMVGKTAEELVGQTGIGLVHPDDRDYTAIKFNEALQQPNTRVLAEYRIPHKDGSYIWVETSAINLLDNPYVQAVVLISHNISERKQKEIELANYRSHLETLVETRTEELSRVNKQLKIHLDWLSAINIVSHTLADSTEFTQIFEKIIEIINDLFSLQCSFIAKLEEGGNELKILAYYCPDKGKQVLQSTTTLLPVEVMSNLSQEEDRIVFLSEDQLNSMSGPIVSFLQDLKVQNIAFVPLIRREQVLGILGLEMRDEGRRIRRDELDLLKIFSTDVAQLIENSRLYDQSKALIALEERNRLARDLHDSVTQVLFSATLLADVLPQIWRRDPELGLQRLEKLKVLTRGALAEMRTMLLELRPYAVIHTPLGDLLKQLAEAVASRTGVQLQLDIDQIPILPEDVQFTYYRIAQEALNNVVKHAQARLVTVRLGATPMPPDSFGVERQEIKLVIQDDGVGFAAMKEDSSRLGVGIMRERAAAIQASLSLDSKPGLGTKVTLIWDKFSGSQP